jgi:hypothetical protein
MLLLGDLERFVGGTVVYLCWRREFRQTFLSSSIRSTLPLDWEMCVQNRDQDILLALVVELLGFFLSHVLQGLVRQMLRLHHLRKEVPNNTNTY